jgi:phosphatidylinositol-4,5-bisphosphate 4-phosphatase
VSNPGLLAKALAGEEVDLNMTSLSLVTPDDIRGLTSGSKSEKAQWRDQKDAYQAIKGPQTFRVLNEHGQMTDVKVNVKPIALNFGVNQGAVAQGGMGSVMRAGAVGAWSNVMDSNRRGLESMLGGLQAGAALGGLVGDYLSRTDVTDKDKSIVRTLADQVKTIWNDESYKKEGNEAHKMTSRIAVLTHMTGNTIAFNCKSGKDRTGVLDVEAKFLAARIDMHGTVPEINARLNVEEQEMYRNFSFNSGNLEMQQYNTGLGGYKNQLLGSTTARLGDDEAAKTFHKGGSKAVGS